MKYCVTERERFEPEYEYIECFNTLEEAQERMKEMYNETCFLETTEKADFTERSAYVRINDGNEFSWDISEED